MSYLGIDVGTSATKVLLLSGEGLILAKATEEYPVVSPRPLWSEQQLEDWWQAVCRGTRRVLAQSGVAPADVEALSFSGQMVGLVALDGTLVTDFWAAYNAVECAARQACLPHLFRELDETDEADHSEAWAAFSKKLKRLLHDALRLGRNDSLPGDRFASRRVLLDERLAGLAEEPPDNPNVNRLQKRLRRYHEALFTFLDHPGVPSDNNHAEREIRPAVIMRKNCLTNRSENGADVQAILMSVYRTLKIRGRDPLSAIVAALRDYVRTGSLPALPS